MIPHLFDFIDILGGLALFLYGVEESTSAFATSFGGPFRELMIRFTRRKPMGQIPDLLSYDYEYENIIFTESHGRSGKRVSGGFGGNVDKGIRTTKTVKAVGCSMLKLLIEQKKLEVVDKHTIAELNTFSQKGKSYEAEPGHHDDLVMGLVLFAWLSQDAFFVEMNDDNILQHLRDRSDQDMLDDLVSFGFRFDAADDYTEPTVVKMGGEWWETSGI